MHQPDSERYFISRVGQGRIQYTLPKGATQENKV